MDLTTRVAPLIPPAPPAPSYPSNLVNPHAPKPTSVLRVVFQNVNGWMANRNSLRPAYSKVNADVLLLADTGMEPTSKLKLHPYISYQTKNVTGTHAGVAILIRPEIAHKVIRDPFYMDTIAVQIETTSGPIIVATCYQPPRFGYPPFNDLDWLAGHHLPTYLLADLNCHHPSFPFHSRTTGLHKVRGEFFYEGWIKNHRLIRHGPHFPTFINNTTKGTAPDIILSNNKIYHNHHISPMDANSSDHLPLKFTISSKPILKKVKCEHLKKADWVGYASALADATKEMYSCTPTLRGRSSQTVVAALGQCVNAINDARQRFIPQVKICTRPFVPTSLKFNRLTKVLNTLNYHYLTNLNLTPSIKHHILMQKRKINYLLREEGKLLMDEYWHSLINDAVSYLSTDPKKYWRKLLRLRGIPRGSVRLTANGLPDGAPLLTDHERERAFRDVFAPRFSGTNEERLADESVEEMDRFFDRNPGICLPYPNADFSRLDERCPYTRLITPSEVKDTINQGTSKAPGEDGIIKEHLRHIPKILLVWLAHIFSACLALGIFPDNMKSALMVFIHKPGKPKCNPANYRPISLLSVVGKIFDKILTNRLTWFLEDNNLQHPH